ncbi:hypothetical protein ABZX88_32480 [Kitasatospora aureofaciens]|uniref:hypothetical protein n=1 Tax=Kitasatospora aureofaciens TaxID=1894 RepID=UPI0033A16851
MSRTRSPTARSAGPAPEATNVVDLMDALRRSLETARKSEKAGEPKKSSGRTAARTSHSPKQTGGKKNTSPKAATGKTTAKRASATGKQQLPQLAKAEPCWAPSTRVPGPVIQASKAA